MAPHEPEVRFFSPMPKGYVFVPKGDVYITKNCRQRSHSQGQQVYVVLNKRNQPIGIRCPQSIFAAVQADHKATAAKRASAVDKRDAAICARFEKAVMNVFPGIPRQSLPLIVAHAAKKRSGRVGRTETVGLDHKAKLAVWAHIRHCHTDYDGLLKNGEDREVARGKVANIVNELSIKWGGPPLFGRKKGFAKKRVRVREADMAKRRPAKQSGVLKQKVAVHPGPRVTTRQMARSSAGVPNSAENPIEITDTEDNNSSMSGEDSGSGGALMEPDSDDEDFSDVSSVEEDDEEWDEDSVEDSDENTDDA
ncbi:hypothetical protein QBC47DRAFT_426794 [Echria macrotheca]|uniref:DUF2293 domain-containing protein n=1 Tax=Echria macrotheca TaxID=438768 RepID=A0AAJ0B202_9PEZI|nr:hypothetical protein QBC47DRAFT_426794 [Echria macrotheca]